MTAGSGLRCPLLVLFGFSSSMHMNGLMHILKRIILSGQPSGTEHFPCIGLEICPLICTEEVAFLYILCILSRNVVLNPYASIIENRYVWALLSKASIKSSVNIYVGVFVSSELAIVSLIAVIHP